MDVEIAIELFKSTGFLMLNKKLIKTLGLIEAALISNYIDKHVYWKAKLGEEFNGWFFLRHKDAMDQLNLKETAVVKAKRGLIEKEIIDTRMKGMPVKEWVKIDFTQLLNLIYPSPQKIGGSSPQKIGGLLRRTNKETILSNFGKTDFITVHDFDKFWEIWPTHRKGSKGKALSSWIKLCAPNNPYRPEWQRIRAAVIKQKKSEQWRADGGKYIPLAVTWLNNKRWLDDPESLKVYKFDGEPQEEDWRGKHKQQEETEQMLKEILERD